MKLLGFLFLFLCLGMPVMADDVEDYFEYEDDTKTVIIGLKESGWSKTSLTIPASVTLVTEGAFFGNNRLSDLYIDGGNPKFEDNVFDDVRETLYMIDCGSGMSPNNIYGMLRRLGADNQLGQLLLSGYQGAPDVEIVWDDELMKAILTDAVDVVLPATLVGDQVFGEANVLGRFTINSSSSISTICCKKSFSDVGYGDGSNMLFYVPTELRSDTKQIFVRRVNTINAGEGVIIHNAQYTSAYADLPRMDDEPEAYEANMLVGVTEPTYIEKTDGDKTNLILSGGKFQPLSNAGTIPAFKAYLQLNTVEYNALGASAAAGLTWCEMPADTTDGIGYSLVEEDTTASGEWMTLGGQRLGGQPVKSGIYLRGNKKVIVK